MCRDTCTASRFQPACFLSKTSLEPASDSECSSEFPATTIKSPLNSRAGTQRTIWPYIFLTRTGTGNRDNITIIRLFTPVHVVGQATIDFVFQWISRYPFGRSMIVASTMEAAWGLSCRQGITVEYCKDDQTSISIAIMPSESMTVNTMSSAICVTCIICSTARPGRSQFGT